MAILILLILLMGCLNSKEKSILSSKVVGEKEVDLHNAILKKENKKVLDLLDQGVDLNARVEGDTPVILASYRGELDLLRELINRNGDLSGALHSAIYGNEIETVQFLLSLRNIEVNEAINMHTDEHSIIIGGEKGTLMTPLMLASFLHRDSTLRILLEKGADINFKVGGRDPLSILCGHQKNRDIFNTFFKNKMAEGGKERFLSTVEELVCGGVEVKDEHLLLCGRYGEIKLFRILMGSLNLKISFCNKEDTNKMKALSLIFACREAKQYKNKRMFWSWEKNEIKGVIDVASQAGSFEEMAREICLKMTPRQRELYIYEIEPNDLKGYRLIDFDFSNDRHLLALDTILKKIGESGGPLNKEKKQFLKYLVGKSNIENISYPNVVGDEAKNFSSLLCDPLKKYRSENLKGGILPLMISEGFWVGVEYLVKKFERYEVTHEGLTVPRKDIQNSNRVFGFGLKGAISEMARSFKAGFTSQTESASNNSLRQSILKGASSLIINENCFHNDDLQKKGGPFQTQIIEAVTSGIEELDISSLKALARGIGGVEKYILNDKSILTLCASSDKVGVMTSLFNQWGYRENSYCHDCLNSLIKVAIVSDRERMIKFLMGKDVENSASIPSNHLMALAVTSNSPKAIKILMEKGVELERVSMGEKSILEYARDNSLVNIFEIVVTLDYLEKKGDEELKVAIANQNMEYMKFLIGKGLLSTMEKREESFLLSLEQRDEKMARLISVGEVREVLKDDNSSSLYQTLLERDSARLVHIMEDLYEKGNRHFSLKLKSPKLRYKKEKQINSQRGNVIFLWDRVLGAAGYRFSIRSVKGDQSYSFNENYGLDNNSATLSLSSGIYMATLYAKHLYEENSSQVTIQVVVDNRPLRPKIVSLEPTVKDNRLFSLGLEWKKEKNVDGYELELRLIGVKDSFTITQRVESEKTKTIFNNLGDIDCKELQIFLRAELSIDKNEKIISVPAVEELSIMNFICEDEKIENLILEKIKDEKGINNEIFNSFLDILRAKNFYMEDLVEESSSFLLSTLLFKSGRRIKLNFKRVKFKVFTFCQEMDEKIASYNNFSILSEEKLNKFLRDKGNLFKESTYSSSLKRVRDFFKEFYSGERSRREQKRLENSMPYFRRRGMDDGVIRNREVEKLLKVDKKINRILYILFFENILNDEEKADILSLISSSLNCSAEYNAFLQKALDLIVGKIDGSFKGFDEFLCGEIFKEISDLKDKVVASLNDNQSSHVTEYVAQLLNEEYGFPLDNEISDEYNNIIAKSMAQRARIVKEIDMSLASKTFSTHLLKEIESNEEVKESFIEYLDEKLPRPFNYFKDLLFEIKEGSDSDHFFDNMEIGAEVVEAMLLDKGVALIY